METISEVKLEDFVDEFAEVMKTQLIDDRKRWGDTWRHRISGGQEARIFAKFMDYWDQWRHGGTPTPWVKVACLGLIAWVRLRHPETLIDQNGKDKQG